MSQEAGPGLGPGRQFIVPGSEWRLERWSWFPELVSIAGGQMVFLCAVRCLFVFAQEIAQEIAQGRVAGRVEEGSLGSWK